MENDLKNLGRMELLQVLLRVTESNEALMAENAELKSASSMKISRSAKVGSIAEEALRVNGFFEAAQRSADDYLREIMKIRDEMVERSKAQAAAQESQGALGASEADQLEQSQLFERIQDQAKTYIQDVQTYANNVMARADAQARGIIDDARMRSDEIIAQANDQAQAIIEEAKTRVFLEETPIDEALEGNELSQEVAAIEGLSGESIPIEELSQEDVPIEGPYVEESVAEELPEDNVYGEVAIQDEAVAEEPESEDVRAVEQPQDEISQSTAPLDIDVIVSDIAATAFSEGELDPNSTGALVRRGRHVKLPEGTAM